MTDNLLNAVWCDDNGYRCIAFRGNDGKFQQKFFKTNDEAINFASTLQGADIWFASSLFANENRKADNVFTSRDLYLDIDVKPDGDYYHTLADAETDINRFIAETRLPEPTRVCSGNGYHLRWIMDEALPKAEWLESARKLKELCEAHGLNADESVTTDSARVLRVPKSKNYKDRENPKEVKLLTDVIVYKRGDIEKAINDAASKIVKPDVATNESFLGGIESSYSNNPQENKEIAKLCLGHLSQERCDDENGWYEVGQALFNCIEDKQEAFDLWNDWSRKSDKYKADYILSRWNAMSERTDESLKLGSLIHWAREDSGNPDLCKREVRKASGMYDFNDKGNAERFIDTFGANLRYDFNKKTWANWDGKHWEFDAAGDIQEYAKSISSQIRESAEKINDADSQKPMRQWANLSANAPKIKAMIELAKSDAMIKCKVEDFDKQSHLISAENGTIDLRTGKLKPHNQTDYITKILPYAYNQNAKCPKFMQWLESVQPKKDVRDFLQQIAGLALTGTHGKRFFVFYGQTAGNGKTTFALILKSLLGEYATGLDINELLQKKFGNSNGHTDQIAKLRGARLILPDEPNENSRFDEAKLKSMTGGDTISASRKGQSSFDFNPIGTILITTNHIVKFNPNDAGMIERLAVVPFEQKVSDHYPLNNDHRAVIVDFMTEAEGILTWAVEGSMRFHNGGVVVPDYVRQATAEYIREQNLLSDFLEDETEFVLGGDYQISVDTLWRKYDNLATTKPRMEWLGKKRFNACVKSYGIKHNSNRTMWIGIGDAKSPMKITNKSMALVP